MTAPNLIAPPGACDTHMHVYEPGYGMAPTALLPPPDGRLEDYRRVQERLGLERAVIVQPTTYGEDNRCTLEAMAALGGSARGVAVVGTGAGDEVYEDLTARGIRGIRFHMLPGGRCHGRTWTFSPAAPRITAGISSCSSTAGSCRNSKPKSEAGPESW